MATAAHAEPTEPENAGDPASRIREARSQGKYERALDIAERELARIQRNDRAAAHELGDARRLVDTLRQIVALPDSARLELAEADRQDEEIEQVYSQGDFARVVAMADSQLEVRKRWLGDRHLSVAWALNNRAAGASALGDLSGALDSYRTAIGIYEERLGREHPDLALVLNNAAASAVHLGRFDLASDLARQSYELRRSLYGRVHFDVAMSLNTWIVALVQSGDLAKAEPLFRETLYILDELETPPAEAPQLRAAARQSLAGILRGRGQIHQAIEEARANVQGLREILPPGHPDIGRLLANLGSYETEAGLDAEAESTLREALGILDESSTASSVARNSYAVLLLRQRRVDEAEGVVRDILARIEARGGESAEVPYVHVRLAQIHQARGEYDKAARELETASSLFEAGMTDLHSLPQALVWRSELFARSGDFASAESTLVIAAGRFEHTRGRQGEVGLDRAATLPIYDHLAAARLRLERPWPAWEAAEKQLARVLLDVLRGGERRNLSETERAREQLLSASLARDEQALKALVRTASGDSASAARIEEARRALTKSSAEWTSFRHEMAEEHPVTEGEPFSREEILKHLEGDEAIIGWLDWNPTVGDTASWVYVLRPGRDVNWVEIPPSPGAVAPILGELRRPPFLPGGLPEDLSRRLWEQRIAPATDALDGVKRLIVIPSGRMLGVPIESLQDGDGQYLRDRFEISYEPSATIHAWLAAKGRGPDPTRPALLIGDPPFREEHTEVKLASALTEPRGSGWRDDATRAGRDRTPEALRRLPRLPGTRLEVEAIRPLVPGSTVLVGSDASEQRLADLAKEDHLREFRIVHIATHGLIDDQVPDLSGLVLAQVGLPDPLESVRAGEPIYDGVLTGREILCTWQLDADLVNLSACETGLGVTLAGEGLVGLAHVFFQVGARSVIVSLWEASDGATALLMTRFYENWLGTRDGIAYRKAEALQEAKAWLASLEIEQVSREIERIGGLRGSSAGVPSLSHSPRPYEHPFYWAPFILIGDPD